MLLKILVPSLLSKGVGLEEIAVLYRAAWFGDKVATRLIYRIHHTYGQTEMRLFLEILLLRGL